MDVIKTSVEKGNSPNLPPDMCIVMDWVIGRVYPGRYHYR